MRKLVTIVGAAIAMVIAVPGAALAAKDGVHRPIIIVESGQGPPVCVVITPGHTQEIPLRACQAALATP